MPKPLKRTIGIVLAYDGTHYSGWQRQKNGPSIQAELEKSLAKIHGHPVNVAGAGRTDAGVHAHGQVASFETDIASIAASKFVPAMNCLLPRDIRILSACEKKEGFHARFSARLRRYRYYFWCGRARDPVASRCAHSLAYIPDITLLNRLASVFLGEYDFSTFTAATDSSLSKVRAVCESCFFWEGSYLVYLIAANAFTHHMVRSIAGSILQHSHLKTIIGSDGQYAHIGRYVEELRQNLEAKDRKRAGPTLPPAGLTLWNVEYEGADNTWD